jgi:hypothetical protein
LEEFRDLGLSPEYAAALMSHYPMLNTTGTE